MKNRTISIIIGLLIGQVIVVSFRSCSDHNRINEVIVDRNTSVKTMDSCFWVMAAISHDVIKERNLLKKECDSLSKNMALTVFYKNESEYYQNLCHKIVKDETEFIKKTRRQLKSLNAE